MRSRPLGILMGLLVLAIAGACSGYQHQRPAQPQTPPSRAALGSNCAGIAIILHWKTGDDHGAKVKGNSLYETEEKNLVFKKTDLTPGESELCWAFAPRDEAPVQEIEWVKILEIGGAGILQGPIQFDPNRERFVGVVYAKHPVMGQIEFPKQSNLFRSGARVEYKVTIKLKNAGTFDADPDIVIKP